jgi:hypothetical protein
VYRTYQVPYAATGHHYSIHPHQTMTPTTSSTPSSPRYAYVGTVQHWPAARCGSTTCPHASDRTASSQAASTNNADQDDPKHQETNMTDSMPADVARAARLVAAVAADDQNGVGAVLKEARDRDRLPQLALALAVRFADIAREFYDTDCQTILDGFAMDAMYFAENAD